MVFSKIKIYESSGGTEYFISKQVLIENERYIIGFVRLRLSENPGMGHIKVLEGCAMIRELHVYGNLNSTEKTMNKTNSNSQHRGYGKELMKEAEKIAIQNGYKKISVISGVGVRNFYRKIGYELNEGYMIKKLDIPKETNYFLIGLCVLITYLFIRIIYRLLF